MLYRKQSTCKQKRMRREELRLKRNALATVLGCIQTNSTRAVELLAQLYDATENTHQKTFVDIHEKAMYAIETDMGFDPICGLECSLCKADTAPVFVAHSGLCEACAQRQEGKKNWKQLCA